MRESFPGRRREHKPHEAPTGYPESMGRREALRKIVNAVVAGTAATSTAGAGYWVRGAFKEKAPKEKTTASERAPAMRPVSEQQPLAPEDGDALAPYTFLEHVAKPHEVPAGALTGKKFADLYATYLGVPDGTEIPETLHIDFKANLATLWREKFGFDDPTRTPEEERTFRERFLQEHADLMNLAEELYSSYDPHAITSTTFETYKQEVRDIVHKASIVFMRTMAALRDSRDFPEERRLIIERMASRVSADTLLACSLTELMPSADGETNALIMDFLLQHAGSEFINRIPSVHDLLPSFGPYQLTPDIFEGGGVGHLAELFEEKLPQGFMPKHLVDVSGATHHRVAYVAAVEHVTQFTGHLSRWETMHVNDLLAHTAPELFDKEVLTFVAAAHHRPSSAYTYFKKHLMSEHMHDAHVRPESSVLTHMTDRALRHYAHKALKNYAVLSQPDELASLDSQVS